VIEGGLLTAIHDVLIEVSLCVIDYQGDNCLETLRIAAR